MIEVKLESLSEGDSLAEVQHVSELKRRGVPMRGNVLASGVETGSLTLSDSQEERTYVWLSEPVCPRKNPLSKRFRVRRFNSIGETWFEIQEWKWYWPVWDTWTTVPYVGANPVPIRYHSIYTAREAVRFYQRKEEPHHAVVDEL